ncbi:MAG: 7TM diverse intracellular signaling domain-containing protein, partial [Sulfuricurvum sp.]
KASIIEMMVVTILVSFAVYHLGLFIAWRRDKVPFWFAMLCLSLALRATTTGEKILLHLFPNISWEMLTRIEYASGYMALPFFVLYFGSLYPKQTSRIAESVYLGTGLTFLSFTFFSSTVFFTATLPYYELVVVTFIIYGLWILYRSLKDKESGSVIAFLAFSIFAATVLHDLLMFENIVASSTDMLPYGFVFYLLAQAAILLLRYASAFRLIETQSNNLETIVGERTKALSALLAQRDLLLRELAHRVKNNLQFIISLLWIQRKEADMQTNQSLKTLEAQIQAIAAVHESLCTQNKISVIEINEYIQKLIISLEQLYPDLSVTFVPSRSIYLQTDHVISLGLIINELVTNHIKYSTASQTPTVHISIQKNLDRNVVLHYNDGADHRETFECSTVSAFGLPKLGWPMIKEFIKQMKGEIVVLHDHVELHFSSNESF